MSQTSEWTNRLALESSPYLRQHARNPVDWYPWGPEALERARSLDRPIFLSIGYSACHWCHVMEHESFEDPRIAQILNEHFVPIKIDREERPDLDQIYMTAVQLMTGHGGWPMSVFLTPDLEPFFGGTYFPPQDRYNLPGFERVLNYLIEVWQQQRDKAHEQARNLTQHLRQAGQLEQGEGRLDADVLRHAAGQLGRRFDSRHGGFGPAPKFLHTMDMRVLLRAWQRFDLPEALHMVRFTLEKMALGGIHDHLGGGFARYSTDERWLVPHFEKMLYDNALLTTVYLEAYQATREPLFREVVEGILGWVEREMTSPEGPFYSALDADSEGEEGKFYVWSAKEIEQILGKEEADLFGYVYGVEPAGNWEGHNILHRSKTLEQCSKLLNVPLDQMRERLEKSRQKLFEVREKRVRPGRDDKMLTSWNALMIGALAEAAQVLECPEHAERASRAADFILTRMRGTDGRLLRTFSSGAEPKLNAYLEDYSYLIDALVSLYEATFEPRWIEAGLELAQVMIDQFWDPEGAGFFYTGKDHETLIARNKDPHDNATPSGNAMAVTGLLRLVKLTGRLDLLEKAEATLRLYAGIMNQHPPAVSQMLIALDFSLGPVQEFAIVADPWNPDTVRVLRAIRGGFRPRKVVAFRKSGEPAPEEMIPLLLGKISLGGNTTTYICQDFSCQAPLLGAETVEKELQA